MRYDNPNLVPKKLSLASFVPLIAALLIAGAARGEDAGPTASAAEPASSTADPAAATGGDPFAMGEKVAFGGFSLGVYGARGDGMLPPIVAGFDYAFHKYMTVGGVFGFSRYDYSSESLTYLTFAARGTFHPLMWFKGLRIPLDPYGVATVGYTHAIWSGYGGYNYSYSVFGPGVGARYWFTDRLSVQGESGIGRGVGLFNISMAFKL